MLDSIAFDVGGSFSSIFHPTVCSSCSFVVVSCCGHSHWLLLLFVMMIVEDGWGSLVFGGGVDKGSVGNGEFDTRGRFGGGLLDTAAAAR